MVIEFTRYHNAYMIHNETLYCSQNEEWRGNYSCLKVRLHFTRDKGFYYTTVFAPGVVWIMFPVDFFVFFQAWCWSCPPSSLSGSSMMQLPLGKRNQT